MHTKNSRLSLLVVFLTFIVIGLGAYTRLKDAGLGCPDWPGCYGKLIAPMESSTAHIEPIKAWIEMIHRYVAGALGLLVLLLAIRACKNIRYDFTNAFLSLLLLTAVILQGLLGMWTVTMRLYPIVVMAHLLGGFTILSLAWVMAIRDKVPERLFSSERRTSYTFLSVLGLIVLVIQIMLGGWTSANYAALVCSDFPTCQGYVWPPMDWNAAFNFGAVGIFDSPGIPLENTARVTIQMAHRCGALIVTIILGSLGYLLVRRSEHKTRRAGFILLVLLGSQLALGILNVLTGLPIAISIAHNLVAACLLLTVIYIIIMSFKSARSKYSA